MQDGLLTSAEAATLLGVSRSRLSRLVSLGDLRLAREEIQGGHVRHWFREIDALLLRDRRRARKVGGVVQVNGTGFLRCVWLERAELQARRRGMLTAAEVAELLGVSRAWVSVLGRRDILRPALRGWEGRTFRAWYQRADVEAYKLRQGGSLGGRVAPSYMGLGPVRFGSV